MAAQPYTSPAKFPRARENAARPETSASSTQPLMATARQLLLTLRGEENGLLRCDGAETEISPEISARKPCWGLSELFAAGESH